MNFYHKSYLLKRNKKGITMFKNVIAVVLLAACTLSCSTIIKGASQTITVSSEPSNAEVLIDGNSMGKTPLSVNLKKNQYTTITVKKPGFNSQIKQMQKSYDPITLLNVFWDLSTTDFISGAAYEYQPNMYHFTLEQEEAAATEVKKTK